MTDRWLAGFLVVSAAAHAAAFGMLASRPARREEHRPPTLVTVEVTKPAPVEAPRPVHTTAPVRASHRLMAAATPPPVRAAPPPVADLTGVTLTNDGPGPGWASAVGDGRPSLAPAALPVKAAPGPAVVGPSDLRRAPEAPPLDEALARNYPPDERRHGVSGLAVIRARVLADGRVRPLAVVSATAPAFAEACKRTLVDSRWSQPLDREARPCATDINYTCRFELGQ